MCAESLMLAQPGAGSCDTERSCPNGCKSSPCVIPRYAEAQLVRCRNCRLVFAGRLPGEAELAGYYSRYPDSGQLSALTAYRYEELLDALERYRETNRLLDVGCGDGHFLIAATNRGWRVSGSEYGEAPRERARRRGLDVRPAPFVAARDEHGIFDVVTCIEVIEHVTQPAQELARIADLLRRRGCLYLTTPNFDSLSRRVAGPKWRVIEYPEHLTLFTPGTLERMLTAAGFQTQSLLTTGLSISDLAAAISEPRGGSHAPDARSDTTADQRLRESVMRSSRATLALKATNAILSRLRAGDTIKGFLIRP